MTLGNRRTIYSILLIIAVMAILLRSERNGPYRDLEALFKTPEASTAPKIPVKAVVLFGTRATGAYNYRGVLAVKLKPDAVAIEPDFPANLIMQKIQIPAAAVSGCTETCFGGLRCVRAIESCR